MESSQVHTRHTLKLVLMIGATVHVGVGVAVALIGNLEGPMGGLLYVAMFAVPMALIAIGIASSHFAARVASAWFGLALALTYSAVLVGNWSGYSTETRAVAVIVIIPTVLLYFAVCGFVVMAKPLSV